MAIKVPNFFAGTDLEGQDTPASNQRSFGLNSALQCCKETHIAEVKAVKPKMVEPWTNESRVVGAQLKWNKVT